MYWSKKNKKTKNAQTKKIYMGGKSIIYSRNNKKIKNNKKYIGGNPVICSPNNKKHIVKTCLTPNVIEEIKDDYNKDHPETPIEETNSDKIFDKFRSIFTDCKDERCFLKEIDDVSVREKYKELLFAPSHPHEWLKNKNEWLTNIDINSIFKQVELQYPEFEYLETTPIDFDTKLGEGQCVEDELCNISLNALMKKGKTKFAAVINLDKHTQGGSHWVSIFASIPEKTIVFFDSAKGGVPKEITAFVKRIQQQGLSMDPSVKFQFLTNKSEHQKGDTECGMYSLYFVIEMLASFKNVDKFISGNISDDLVEDLRFKLFNHPEISG